MGSKESGPFLSEPRCEHYCLTVPDQLDKKLDRESRIRTTEDYYFADRALTQSSCTFYETGVCALKAAGMKYPKVPKDYRPSEEAYSYISTR